MCSCRLWLVPLFSTLNSFLFLTQAPGYVRVTIALHPHPPPPTPPPSEIRLPFPSFDVAPKRHCTAAAHNASKPRLQLRDWLIQIRYEIWTNHNPGAGTIPANSMVPGRGMCFVHKIWTSAIPGSIFIKRSKKGGGGCNCKVIGSLLSTK